MFNKNGLGLSLWQYYPLQVIYLIGDIFTNQRTKIDHWDNYGMVSYKL